MLETYGRSTASKCRGAVRWTDELRRFIHDPQPAALIPQKPEEARWIWRCHIDISHPQRKVWNFLRQFVVQYDGAIFSLPRFRAAAAHPQFLISPSIDPL